MDLKYAFMSFSCPELSLQEMLTVADLYGYSGIEPRIAVGHKHGIELTTDAAQRKAIKKMAEDSGVSICCIATGCSFADSSKVTMNIQEACKAIALAADVGSNRVRVFGGNLPAGVTHNEAMPVLIEALSQCADAAEAQGVTLCLETHDSWSDPRLAAQVVKAVNRHSVGINWDIAHPIRLAGVSVEESFQTVLPWLQHVHVHDGIHLPDGRMEFKAMGEGSFDHRSLITLLQSINYNGFLSGEWIDYNRYDQHLPHEIKLLRQYEQ